MSDLDPVDDPRAIQMIDADDEPVDPHAHEFDDADEGALEDGTPVTSLHGSETIAWGTDA